MKKLESKPIKIGGRALEMVQRISANSFSTMKHTAEVLIELGHLRVQELKDLGTALKEEINKFNDEGREK